MNLVGCKKVVYEYFELEVSNSENDCCHYRRNTREHGKLSWELLEFPAYGIWYPVQHMRLVDQLEDLFQDWKLKNSK